MTQARKKKKWSLLGNTALSLIIHGVILTAIMVFYVPKLMNTTPVSMEIECIEDDSEEGDTKDAPAEPETKEEKQEVAEPAPVAPPVQPEDAESPEEAEEPVPTPQMTPNSVPTAYSGRTAAKRAVLSRKYGGKHAVSAEKAVMNALRWLKKTQNADGSWAPSQKQAMAGLCLLAFLAHGEDTHSAEFGHTVSTAIEYLVRETIRCQAQFPGGAEKDPYVTAIVAYALGEAYGMTRQPTLLAPLEMLMRRIIDGQQPNGGYDYGYRKNKRWDLSVSCWQFQAMKAAFVARCPLPGLPQAMKSGARFIKNTAFSEKNGQFGYTVAGKGSDGLQGAGVFCLQLLGESNSKAAQRGLAYITKSILNANTPKLSRLVWDDSIKSHGGSDNVLYQWYYCTQAMFQAGGRNWEKWNNRFAPMLVKHQHADGYWSSPGKSPYGKNKISYDQWYTTALATLCLQVYYRYLPSLRR